MDKDITSSLELFIIFSTRTLLKKGKKRNKPEKVVGEKGDTACSRHCLITGQHSMKTPGRLKYPSSSSILGKMMFQGLNLYLFDQKSEKRAHGATVDSKSVCLSPEH